MKIKKAFIYLFGGMIISMIIIALCIAQLFYYRNKLTESQEIRYKSYKIAEELRQSSEDLTLYARLYVTTGDTLWETKYWNVLKIRNGEMPRPDGRIIPLRDSMLALGFIQSEFELLKTSEFYSNQLVVTEKKAFDIMKGRFSDNTINISANHNADKDYAQIMLFDSAYLEAKIKIMNPIQDFKARIDKRTQDTVNKYNSRDRIIILSTLSLILIMIVLSYISYILIKKRSADYVKAEHANRIKSEFLANMSHEIRTPMNAVLGYAELLATTGVDETQKVYIESIKSSGRALLALINDILDLSKIEIGRIELEFAYIDTRAFFSEFEKIFFLKVSEKGVKYILEISAGTPEGLYVDEARLRQILFNLIGNAIKFTNAGFVRLKVFTQNPKQSVTKDNIIDESVELVFEVEDTGIGISENFQEEIFDPFTQEGGRTKFGGTGLGLAITRKLIFLMNGAITFKSEVGKGTTFRVTIPDVAFVRNLERIPANSVKADEQEPKGGEINRAEGIRDLTKLICSLETTYLDIWKTFSDQQPIDEIEDFGSSLINLGKDHDAVFVSEYGNEMVSAARSFNIKTVLTLLKKFPEIIEELKDKVQKIYN